MSSTKSVKTMSSSKSTSSTKRKPGVNAAPPAETKKKRSAISSESFHWTDKRDEAFTALIISNHVYNQNTSAQTKRMWEKTVKECFDQDIFKDDKIKFYDASEDDAEARKALIRRFKSRVTVLEKNCEAFISGNSFCNTL